jgi:hypothetical protein
VVITDLRIQTRRGKSPLLIAILSALSACLLVPEEQTTWPELDVKEIALRANVDVAPAREARTCHRDG